MNTNTIDKRYTELSNTNCCLSCGDNFKYFNVKSGEICIDLGSGQGHDAIKLSKLTGKKGFVYGIDIAQGMINKAINNINSLNIKNVKFIKSDLEKIELEFNIADLIISNCVLNHVEDKKSVWNEIYRILKPKGRFVVSDIYSIDRVPDIYKNDPIAVSECWAGAITKEEYLEILKNTGFININILSETAGYDKGKIKVASWTISGYKPD